MYGLYQNSNPFAMITLCSLLLQYLTTLASMDIAEQNETKPNEILLCNVTVPYCALLVEWNGIVLNDIGNLFLRHTIHVQIKAEFEYNMLCMLDMPRLCSQVIIWV